MRKLYCLVSIRLTVSTQLYTLPEDNKTIFTSSYKLHLPTKQELINAIETEKLNIKLSIDEEVF